MKHGSGSGYVALSLRDAVLVIGGGGGLKATVWGDAISQAAPSDTLPWLDGPLDSPLRDHLHSPTLSLFLSPLFERL